MDKNSMAAIHLEDRMTMEFENIEGMQISDLGSISVLSRLILQKILFSDSSKYIVKKYSESLHKKFLSENIKLEECNITYKTLSTLQDTGYYSSSALEFSLKWETGKEILDSLGNVWQTYTLRPTFGLSGLYNCSESQFEERIDVFNSVSELISELKQLVPNAVRVMVMNNSERIVRDKKNYELEVSKKVSALMKNRKWIYNGLRVGSKVRTLEPADLKVLNIAPGQYKIVHNVGSNYTPRERVYTLTIPEDPGRFPTISRCA